MLSERDRLTPERLQEHMRSVARQQYDAVAVPPFTAYFHPSDPLPYLNYAIPDGAPGDASSLVAPLVRLRAEFGIRRRRPRFEFVEAVFPELERVLQGLGFVREGRPLLMTCRPEDLRPVPPVDGLSLETLSASSSLEAFRELLKVQKRAFSLPNADLVSDDDARWLRDGLGDGLAFVGRVYGEAAAVSMFLAPTSGLAELVGICTLESHRRKGLGGALTHAALAAAFHCGVSLAFLAAGDERAGHVYESAGFAPFGHVLYMVAREERGA